VRWNLRRGLLLRIIAHGVILLGISAVGFLTIVQLVLGASIEDDIKTYGQWFGDGACRRSADPATRAEVRAFPAAVAVYTSDGTLEASSALYETSSPSRDDLVRLRRGEPSRGETARLMAIACPADASRYAVIGGPPPALSVGRLAWLVAVVVGLVAIGSIPLARSIVMPLRELNAVAKSLGEGKLDARVQIRRRDEIGELAESFNAMAANLEGHLRMEKELLANVSHELRTPLARVRVVLETALDDPSRAGLLIKEISRDLADLERLTDDVLAAIRLDFATGREAGGLFSKLLPVDLAAAVRDSVARFAEAHPDREISLDAAGVNVTVKADHALLARLFANLLDNARKYSSAAIRVGVSRDPSHGASVVVEDLGIGIDADDLGRVFDPFFRSSGSRAGAVSGTGLGLTLSRRIVQAHHGHIGLESEPGKSTKVTVTFPIV
jgi:signal transduction histidine kinase